jgi:hypothetical protein
MTSFGTGSSSSSACRGPALDRTNSGLLGGTSQLAASNVGLAAIEELARVLGAAAGEEKSMVQHGFLVPSCASSVDDLDHSSIRLSLCQYLSSLFAR